MPKKRIPRSKLRFTLLKWHRRIGASLAVIVILLSVTGLLLNHSDQLQLAQEKLTSRWVLGMYGVKAPIPAQSFFVEDRWFRGVDKHLYVDGVEVGYCLNLKGVVSLGRLLVVACEKNLILLTSELEVVERLSEPHGLPVPFNRIGLQDGYLVVDAEHPNKPRRFDIDQLSLTPLLENSVQWSASLDTPQPLQDIIASVYTVDDLNVERLLLDVHSGRFFGPLGVWIVDLSALLFLFLSCSGFWLWWRRR